MKLFTIGFTHKSAEDFFTRLERAGVKRILDIRLNNVSQLAGFAKRDDLRYFAKAIAGIDYTHVPELAPTEDILKAYRADKKSVWPEFERQFKKLMMQRHIEKSVSHSLLDHACLLCSEDKPDHCHRRLVAEYLAEHGPRIEIVHL
jgi:uncharacterized protein (DUF488 family)